ncbi:hypothetical protein DFS33DRAFT_677310 [Desarmillaria ectypa]|nr:hypothetical protein DFS33DRAFT_677310 [Desarmillaria ectypa]
MESDVLCSLCAGLVTIVLATMVTYQSDTESMPTFGFVHYTAQEYLETRQSHTFPGIHLNIAQSCLNHLFLNNLHLDISLFTFTPTDKILTGSIHS